MPEFEYEFSNQDKQLTVTQESSEFNGKDYIRLTIYPTEAINNIVTLPNNQEGIEGQAIFFSSLNNLPYDINVSPFGVGLDELRLKTLGGPLGNENNDFQIFKNSDNNIYIKPNEIFNDYGLPQGNYRIQIDFLNQLRPPAILIPDEEVDDPLGGDDDEETGDGGLPATENFGEHYQFIIKQISTSRKEVRVKLLNQNILNDSDIIVDLINNLNDNINGSNPEFLDDDSLNPNFKYQFKHVLNIGTGDHIPIMNYFFDRVTDGKDNQSLILKLYDTLPTQISTLSLITIEREVLTTQTEDVFYFSDVPDVFFGDGLDTSPFENWINPDNNNVEYENFDEISSSIDGVTLNNLVSQSQYDYPNLNTDFNDFKN